MKHCENCEHWIKVFVTYYGEYKDLSSKTKDDKTTEFGRCKKALFRNESSADEEIDIVDAAAVISGPKTGGRSGLSIRCRYPVRSAGIRYVGTAVRE